VQAVLEHEMKEPPVLDVFGLFKTFRPNSKSVRAFAPAASIAAVSFSTAQFPKLSIILTRFVAEERTIAVVAAVVPRLVILFPLNTKPSMELAVALPVITVSAFKIDEVSRNSQFSTAKSVGVDVPVAVKKLAISAKLATKRKFCSATFAAVTGMFAVAAVLNVSVGRLLPTPRPIIEMPATSSSNEVASEIVSAWPGFTMIRSPELAEQRPTA
jgi:hypothetical protein